MIAGRRDEPWRLGQINEPPANTRLRAAMDVDQVPYSEAEFALLVKIRGIRTKVLHGQGRKLPSEEELRLAVALVNRVLLFRLQRLAAG